MDGTGPGWGDIYSCHIQRLYIADAYHDLLVVASEGGLATPLATHVEGKPILFANDLDIRKNGSIYFTGTSKIFNRM